MHVVTFSGLLDLKVNGQPLAGREACGYDEGSFEEYSTEQYSIAHIHTLGPQKTGDGARSTQPWYIIRPSV